MTDAGMPMPALVLRMPMPNYASFFRIPKKVSIMDQNLLKINGIFRFFWSKILVGEVYNIANLTGLTGFCYLLQMFTVTPSRVQLTNGTEILLNGIKLKKLLFTNTGYL
jgi:hypothetical protein